MSVQIFSQASDLPQAAWAALSAHQAQANIILPVLRKLLAREQRGIPTHNHTWVVMFSSRNPNEVRYIFSLTDSILSTYPAFIFTTVPFTYHRYESFVGPMKALVSALRQYGISRRRIYSVFAPKALAEAFAHAWSESTGIRVVSDPYYNSWLSTVTPSRFSPAPGPYDTQDLEYRCATEGDIPQVARLCFEFAETSPPFQISREDAFREATHLVRNQLVWVCAMRTKDAGWQAVSLVAFTRNTDVSATITKVFTLEKAQRRGIAGKLTSKVCQYLFSKGKQQISLFVGVTNSAATVYQRLGFPMPPTQANGQPMPTNEQWVEYGFDQSRVTLGQCSDLEIREDDCGGIGVFSKDATIDPLTILVKIKKSSVLSVRSNAELSPEAVDAIPYGLDAQLQLAAVLYVEILKGAESRWHGYLQSLPQHVDLPLVWMLNKEKDEDASESIKWLRGTEAEKILCAGSEDHRPIWDEVVAFYETIAAPRISSIFRQWERSQSVPLQHSLRGFFHAFSLVSSRAFVVDAFHGLSMVPIADAFNHTVDNHVHLETEFDVCPECGSYKQCPHDREGQSSVDPICDGDEQDDLYYEMVAKAAIPPHTEVFNTYGEHLSNAQLLNQYGFVLDMNENDRISWTLEDILSLIPGISSEGRLKVAVSLQKILSEVSAGIRDLLRLSELLYWNDSPFDAFFVESEGKCSFQLWIAVLYLVLQKEGPIGHNSERDQLYSRVYSILMLQLRLEGAYLSEEEEINVPPPTDSSVQLSDAKLLSLVSLHIAELCELRRRNTGKEGTSEISLFDMLDDHGVDIGPLTRQVISIVATERAILESSKSQWTELADHLALMVE
ncbi:hypothetical protein CVT24_004272 [Panaeolus cyanescens]|uniref:N-acetyltransferase domain-containing protein n=1 Tax=Panaeolus cyanescens TaxID=181874 RepID=A0A409VA86_9AGAR|nr:hypothetical protein CVT24_004272 [Panaeolus cyanescens]